MQTSQSVILMTCYIFANAMLFVKADESVDILESI